MSDTEREPGDGAEPQADADPASSAPDPKPDTNGDAKPIRKKRRAREAEIATEPSAPDAAAALDEDAEQSQLEPEPDIAPRLLPEGNPLELVRGPIAILLGSLIAFVVMAIAGHYRLGVPIAALGILVATFGALDLLGSFGDPDERVARTARLAALRWPLAIAGGGFVFFVALVTLAIAGLVPVPVAAVGVPAAFLTTVVGVYYVGEEIGVFERDERSLLKRHGFWLIALAAVLYLPMLGSHSLTDPWETHYGEVSREILSRDDWISLWWAQDGWFWSKPVFDFWIQALAMAALGVHYRPNEMLSLAGVGRSPWPEWAVRLPIYFLTVIAVYLLYKAVARVFGRRAGLLGGVVLLTMPQWFLVSHQTMTDMPFVATMAAAMALFLLGAHEEPEREVRVYEVDLGVVSLRLSAYHLVIGAIIACALPQILYLLSRNLDIRLSPFGIHTHSDSFMSGSAQNCGLPGNEACHQQVPLLRGLSPALQGLIWLQTLCVFLFLNWGERRAQRLCYLAAWFFMALSTMAKGPAGVGLPVLCALAYVLVTKRYRQLLAMEITSGALILFAVAMPWFVAMYARHGQPFTDRLLFHDMFKRAFTHVHDTNEGDDVSFRFYVWQLGYAMFPWTALAPAALIWWLRRREDGDGRGDASVFLAMWFLLGFALFSLMLTKFHHYILPIIPAAAMLIGIFLDDVLRGARPDVTATSRAPPEPTAPRLRAGFDGPAGGDAAARAALEERASKDLMLGGTWLVGGLVVTALSFAAAGPGGTYFVTTGAIVYGVVRLVSGFSARARLEGAALPAPVLVSALAEGAAEAAEAPRTSPASSSDGSAPSDESDTSPEAPSDPEPSTPRANIPLYASLLLGALGLCLWLTWSGEPSGAAGRSIVQTVIALAQRGALAATLMTIATAAAFAVVTLFLQERAPRVASLTARFEGMLIGAVAIGGALLVALVGRDLISSKDGQPSQIRLLHLFTYNYKRPWPASLDFGAALWFFLIASAILFAALAVAAWRRQVVAAIVVVAVLFSAWGLDVYFVKTSPHWGQRETLLAYYRANAEIPGPIVAYQMNWKGENFYTGNAIPAFVSSGKKFTDYILEEKKKGKKTFYFLTEHGRTGTLQGELGMPKIFDKLTTPELDNKFVLVRATFE